MRRDNLEGQMGSKGGVEGHGSPLPEGEGRGSDPGRQAAGLGLTPPPPLFPRIASSSLLCQLGWSFLQKGYYFHCGFVTLMPRLHQRHDPSSGALASFSAHFSFCPM